MAKFKVDSKDIYFNFFEVLKIHEKSQDVQEHDIKQIFEEYLKFCENEIYPTRQISDHLGVKLTEKGVEVAECLRPLTKLYYEKGWFGLGLPEEIGGIPVPEPVTISCLSLGISCNTAWMMYPGLSKAALNMLRQVGSTDQQMKLIPKIVSGEYGGTMCLTESEAGSDVGALKTTATPIGEGKYKIKGVKIFISGGDNNLFKNIIHLVLARTPGAPSGTKGISLFIVPKFKIHDDGSEGKLNDVVCTKIEEKMGIHASATCELSFGQQNDCEGHLLGGECEGMSTMFLMMNEARLVTGIQGESQANLAYMLTEQYVKERVQFGTELIQHPDVKRMLLRMRSMGRGLRAFSLYTASLLEEMRNGDSLAKHELELLTPMCKAYCSDEGFKVCVEALQSHGGYGYCRDYGIEQFVRDGKIATIYEGTNGIQAIDFVIRKILRDQGTVFKLLLEKIQGTINQMDVSFWTKEVELFSKILGQVPKILNKLLLLSSQNDSKQVLFYCTDFLQYCGNLVVGWNLAKNALKALEIKNEGLNIGQNNGQYDKEFLESKIIDLRIFCQNFLTQNLSLAESILNYDLRIEEVHV